MKIYVAVCCVTYDTRGATGWVRDIKVFHSMEDAKKPILEEIEDLKKAQRILDLQEFYGEGLYNCRYIAIEGYDDASEQTFYLWRIKEFEVKEE